MSLFDLTGKVAIITGSSRGIGQASAVELARQGARVVISSRKQAACDAVAAAINAEHGDGHAIAVAASISDKPALQHLVDETRRAFGRIDVLVCNAASNPYYGPMAGIEDDQFRKILENNVLSNHWLIQMVAPEMRERKAGSIVIVSSVFQLARNYAVEYGVDNVRVNCIAPGLIKTDFARALWDTPEAEQRSSRATPLRRLGDPVDIAGAVVYLASDASRYMTGQAMVVDGGVTIGLAF
jgi:NAD(P)-dependent dehydrogenase (short-subunit alcohol dehydrogenase family)